MSPAVVSELITAVRQQQELIDAARELGYFALLVDVLDGLDEQHRAVLRDVPELDDPDLRDWAAAVVGVDREIADRAVAAFRDGTPLPTELTDALAAVPSTQES
jgi:hypothetical protein